MSTAPRKRRFKPRLAPLPDLSGDMLGLLAELQERISSGECIAIGIVEVQREGLKKFHEVGAGRGFRDALAAGCDDLKDLVREEE